MLANLSAALPLKKYVVYHSLMILDPYENQVKYLSATQTRGWKTTQLLATELRELQVVINDYKLS